MGGTIREHIEIVEGAGGPKACIAGHRIRVMDVAIWHEKLQMTVDEIVDAYPITHADVHAALAYYWDNREEIDQRIEQDRTNFEEHLRTHVSLLEEKFRRIRGG